MVPPPGFVPGFAGSVGSVLLPPPPELEAGMVPVQPSAAHAQKAAKTRRFLRTLRCIEHLQDGLTRVHESAPRVGNRLTVIARAARFLSYFLTERTVVLLFAR
jgi:hypothetical protein